MPSALSLPWECSDICYLHACCIYPCWVPSLAFNVSALQQESLSRGGCITPVQVRDWYVESFKELRNFRPIRDAENELKFTDLLKHIYHRHRCAALPFAGGSISRDRACSQASSGSTCS